MTRQTGSRLWKASAVLAKGDKRSKRLIKEVNYSVFNMYIKYHITMAASTSTNNFYLLFLFSDTVIGIRCVSVSEIKKDGDFY